MPRHEYFQTMGNNCRLLKLAPMAAEAVVCGNPHTVRPEDYDNFFEGYWYGERTELVNLPKWESVTSPEPQMSDTN